MRYLIFVLALCVSSPAWGECKQKDLAGTYLLYGSPVEPVGAFVCEISIKQTGKLRKKNCGGIISLFFTVNGGRLVINQDCILQGLVRTSRGPLSIAQASLRHGSFFGIYFFEGAEGTFSAVGHNKLPEF